MLQTFSFEKFLHTLKQGLLKVDFDARSGYNRPAHNHGTKFRVAANLLPTFYETVKKIWDKPLDPKECLKKIDVATVYELGDQIEEVIGEGPTILE